jgi:hypothetical protein
VHDAHDTLVQPRLAAVRPDALEQEVNQLLLAAREMNDTTCPGAMQPRDSELRQFDRVACEARRHVDDRAVIVVAREFSQQGCGGSLPVEAWKRRRNAPRLTPLPKRTGGPNDILLECCVGSSIRPRKLCVEAQGPETLGLLAPCAA